MHYNEEDTASASTSSSNEGSNDHLRTKQDEYRELFNFGQGSVPR